MVKHKEKMRISLKVVNLQRLNNFDLYYWFHYNQNQYYACDIISAFGYLVIILLMYLINLIVDLHMLQLDLNSVNELEQYNTMMKTISGSSGRSAVHMQHIHEIYRETDFP